MLLSATPFGVRRPGSGGKARRRDLIFARAGAHLSLLARQEPLRPSSLPSPRRLLTADRTHNRKLTILGVFRDTVQGTCVWGSLPQNVSSA